MRFLQKHPEYLLYVAFVQSLIATLGSLYFSEIKLLPACVLCWYQRAMMYPLTLVLGTGIVHGDKQVVWYAIPLSLIGAVIAAYHTALQYGWIQDITPCVGGVSCSEVQIALFGFVTIPLMSLVGFIVVFVSLVLYQRTVSSVESEVEED